nr:box C/D snoRNA protein 1 [Leptinotarsa decemlineata]
MSIIMEDTVTNEIPDVKSKSDSRLGACEVCATRNAKYTCPRCEVKTCSLKCSKIHKLELECNGLRDRTKYIPLKKFTNLDLSSDYRLLEEITRSVESSRKTFGRNRWKDLPPALFKLRNAARTRRINLKFLPFKFARRKNNSTAYFHKQDSIYWHIEWIFVNADMLKVTDVKVCETEKLATILSKHLTVENETFGEKLHYYQAVGIPGVKLFLKAEEKGTNKFYELDMTLSLSENLEKKLIIEHPVIHVLLKDQDCGYNVIDSDDEEEHTKADGKLKSGKEVVDSIVSKAESNENLYKTSKNFLFTSEYSDDEIDSE